MNSDRSNATLRYKEILAELTEAAAELRERDRKRAVELSTELVALEDEMLRAGERARLSAGVARLHWERALDLLWAESWMQLRLPPDPDPHAHPDRLQEYDTQVMRASDVLRNVVKRRWYDRGRR